MVSTVPILNEDHFTDPGGREYNEDSVDARLENSAFSWFVIADGLGGHGGGQYASRIAVESVNNIFQQPTSSQQSPAQLIESAFQLAHQQIRQTAANDPRVYNMQTTIVLLHIRADEHNNLRAYWGHVGDSRLYLIRRNKIFVQTKDHSVVQYLLDVGEIEKKDVPGHPDRNRLLSSLGSKSDVKMSLPEGKKGTFDKENVMNTCGLEGVLLIPGDVLLLCTDGVWDPFPEEKLKMLVQQRKSPEQMCSEIKNHIHHACEHTEYDNLTAIVIQVCPQTTNVSPKTIKDAHKSSPKQIILVVLWIILVAMLLTGIAIVVFNEDLAQKILCKFKECSMQSNVIEEPKKINNPSLNGQSPKGAEPSKLKNPDSSTEKSATERRGDETSENKTLSETENKGPTNKKRIQNRSSRNDTW